MNDEELKKVVEKKINEIEGRPIGIKVFIVKSDDVNNDELQNYADEYKCKLVVYPIANSNVKIGIPKAGLGDSHIDGFMKYIREELKDESNIELDEPDNIYPSNYNGEAHFFPEGGLPHE